MSKKEKKTTVGDLVGALGRRCPYDLAEDWDNVGFLAGDAADAVSGIVVAVNLGPEALAAAEAQGANVVVCHHPPIFKPVSKLTRSASPFLYEAIRKGISVIALHTNFDLSSEDLCRDLAAKLGFGVSGFLAPRGGTQTPRSLRLGKFITYVPEKNLEALREAVTRAGAGRIGDYTQCSFSWEGEGTFLGGPGANPSVGKSGQLERTRERRFEVVFPWKSLGDVVAAAKAVHPYEEMAYDVLELANTDRTPGYGFYGDFEGLSKAVSSGQASPLTFPKLLDGVKQAFQLSTVMVSGPALSAPDMPVQRLGFSPGSGSSFISAASAKGVEVYVCGEVGYHQMLEARQKKVTLVMLGHSYSERFFVETVSEWCAALGPVKKVFETIHENF